MTRKRLYDILDHLIAWAFDHDKEFQDCFAYAMHATDEELKELGFNVTSEDGEESATYSN